ncbi:MAG: Holliday junction branch migration protein RuvA, partial [Syntrophomonadaceae bacterium]|nr:Holliday junction branch migration protein RuvA [Syntrophomonadaceae bacterium]
VTVFTSLQFSENDARLFGFSDRDELSMFKMLTAINGIGAKVAHNIIGTLAPQKFYNAILSGDEKSLLAAPGVGKKMAQRMVFELKDKLAGDAAAVHAALPVAGEAIEELLQAMEALSYTRSEVMSSILDMQNKGQLSGELTENVKALLKRMAGRK